MELESINIDNDGMEFDIGSGEEEEPNDAGFDIENPEDSIVVDYYEDVNENIAGRELFSPESSDPSLEPYEGMEFDSEEACRIFYNSYARRIGFSIRASTYHRSRRDGSIICRQIVCSRQGFHHERDRGSKNKQKRPRAPERVGCKAMFVVKKQDNGRWVVSKLLKEHNHELVPPDKVHRLRSHRHVSGTARSLIDTLQAAGIGPSGVIRHEKEVKADDDTINAAPVLKTPSPMEKQAASIYTRRTFTKFQDELVETLATTATKIEDTATITTYRVAKFGEDHKVHIVNFHLFEMKAHCSCRMFEFSGIICRHILAVFRVTNVLTLPSHYVLKRWTRNAKSGIVVDERALELPSNSRESSNDRFNNLRQEAIKFVDEGAKSFHSYNVAMVALKEASKKIAAIRKQGSGIAQIGTLVNGNNQEVHVTEGNHLDPLQKCSTEVSFSPFFNKYTGNIFIPDYYRY
ncbi:hypothetical protein GIB67_033738 [Kingdonia uniflora]|uniref:Protein FAR1-RELATED SEQUENCE n=1 Tax=Kingdonia uniflora TaxID=39325 RepID=A0A7J7P431_9MAGN|nr:hypothetical protein GIB67_033738 [Kingdonia uniflora]